MNKSVVQDKPLAFGTILFFILILIGYALSTYLFMRGILPLKQSFFFNILLGYLVFTPLHEASHGNISGANPEKKWLDILIGEMSGILLFAPFVMFKVLHLRHHSNTNHKDKDPDYWVAHDNPLKILLTSITIMPHYYYNAIFNPTSRIKEELPKAILRKALMVILVLTVSLYLKTWAVVVLWPFAAICSLGILAIVFDWLPHYPYVSQERYYDTRIFNWRLLTPFLLFQNYHLIHHLYPRIPWYRYRKAFLELEEDLRSKKVTIID